MPLIPDWKRLAPRLWSVRLAVLAAILSAAEVAVGFWLDGRAPLLVLGACFVSLGAGVARVIAQPKLIPPRKKRVR